MAEAVQMSTTPRFSVRMMTILQDRHSDPLIDEHCMRHNVREDQLGSPRRTRRNARLRAEIAIKAQQFGVATLHEVATHFNHSDSTLCHAIRHLLNNSHSDEQ